MAAIFWQPCERLVQRQQLCIAFWRDHDCFIKRHLNRPAAPFAVPARSRLIYQQVTHNLCGSSKEVGAVLPASPSLFHQTQICFVDERSGLQGVVGALAFHMPMSQVLQLVVRQGHQFFESCRVAVAQLSNLTW
jgi:hypothetical protein